LELLFKGFNQYNLSFMNRIVIAVGSARKPKLAAVRDALDEVSAVLAFARSAPNLADGASRPHSCTQFEIIGVEVPSGVAHTPSSRGELMQGARQRAEALEAMAKENHEPWSFFVGLEGGLDRVEENGDRRVFLESWAYVSDGMRGHFGRSGAVEVPEGLAEEVLVRGTELSVAIDRFAGEAGIRDAQGAWGVLCANKINRQEAFRVALIAAFAPFYNASMYREKRSTHA
jgi:inosine/xanthosine triphosphatase